MGKLVMIMVLSIHLLVAQDIYEKNCVTCHKDLPVTIDKYFYRYLLKYSSQKDVKKAMFTYMKNPTEKTTIMPEAFTKRFGIKEKTRLSDDELLEALDSYWNTYKVFGKLK